MFVNSSGGCHCGISTVPVEVVVNAAGRGRVAADVAIVHDQEDDTNQQNDSEH